MTVSSSAPASAAAGAVRYADLTQPEEGVAVRVAPGVSWVRMPLPFALDHINLWLLDDGHGWTLVDTGYSSNRTRTAWETLFAGALAGKPLTRIIATHFHPDHIGLAGWMMERWPQARFATSLSEWLYGRMLSLERLDLSQARTGHFYHAAGAEPAMIETLVARANLYSESVWTLPPTFHRLRHGQELVIGADRWQVLMGQGHTPEQVCLYAPERGLFLSGDQVLPRISPNISVWPTEPDAEPLSDFLATLAALRPLAAGDPLVLPSHGQPFHNLAGRIEELITHHHLRLEETWSACRVPHTAAEITRLMFNRPLDPHQTMFALGEAIAHLNHLCATRRIVRETDAAGIDRYRQV